VGLEVELAPLELEIECLQEGGYKLEALLSSLEKQSGLHEIIDL